MLLIPPFVIGSLDKVELSPLSLNACSTYLDPSAQGYTQGVCLKRQIFPKVGILLLRMNIALPLDLPRHNPSSTAQALASATGIQYANCQFSAALDKVKVLSFSLSIMEKALKIIMSIDASKAYGLCFVHSQSYS
ncbi:hypothetical protein VNO80_28283 [Phaseolus coccineus]|uniref:Uncharacterized protein n=1 Tax=Phaseolus coccineus TaxID=3886 RepID=A0AAN9QDV1_PHACN